MMADGRLVIGLCYEAKEPYLKAGRSRESVACLVSKRTIRGLRAVLDDLGYRTEAIPSARDLARRLSGGHRWDLIFNYSGGVYGQSCTAQVPALCELYEQAYTLSDPLTSAVCSNKSAAKHLVQTAGVPTARFQVFEKAASITPPEFPPPWFIKPLAEGNSIGISADSLVQSSSDLHRKVTNKMQKYKQPFLLEEFLPGRELTVGIIGSGKNTDVLGVMEIDYGDGVDAVAYTGANKREHKEKLVFTIPDDVVAQRTAESALLAYRRLGCRDAARLDFRLAADGRPFFIEANALPGLRAVDSDLPKIAELVGLPYSDLIEGIVTSALQREPTTKIKHN